MTSTPPLAKAKTTGAASGRRREISHVSNYLGVNAILLAGREAPLVPAAPCRAAEGACRRAKEGGEKKRGRVRRNGSAASDLRLVTFSIQSSVFLTPVISTQSTRMENAAFNWSQRDVGLGLQIRYCRIDSILLKAANRFVSWQTQQIFHPGVLPAGSRH